ncbi:MAG: FAD-dependent oxidoreductase [Candidatus Omnitrophota bacterium]|nr:FAD-dependent oxidoreductase [Candidatus Omnitrophota bacterium]
MKKIVCIGNSPAVVGIIDSLRSSQEPWEITWVGLEDTLPYQQSLFVDFLAGKKNAAQLLCRPESYYRDTQVNLHLEKKITRINLTRQKIHFEEKQQLDYNFLVLADAPGVVWPDIKGTNKTGVYALHWLSDVKGILKSAPFGEGVFIQSDTLRGLQIAHALAQHGKEIGLVTSAQGFFASLSLECRQWLIPQLEKAGVRIIENTTIAEILGEGEAVAVRLQSGKIYAAQTIIFPEAPIDLRLLKETPLQVTERISVNSCFQTNVENVFAIDQLCSNNGYTLTEDLIEQGKMVAAKILGQEIPNVLRIDESAFNTDNWQITVLGKPTAKADLSSWEQFDPALGKYGKLFIVDQRPVGAVLINAPDQKDQYLSWLEGKTPLPVTPDLATEGLQQGLPS